ncbi:MAG TPA: S41 family peptidase, partial [Mucilaginibacter sp.]|nr:S41 family peptidase [Mucilaginibacter sp.]
RATMDKVFDHAYSKLNAPMNEIAFFNLIKSLVSQVEDGHTDAFLPADANRYLLGHAKLFPLQLRLAMDRAFVPCLTREFAAGTELLAINGVPIRRIRKDFFAHLASDGGIETGKYADINTGHTPFFYIYYLLYGEQPTFRLTYKDAQGDRADFQMDAVKPDQLGCMSPQTKPNRYLQLAYPSPGVAAMTIGTFLDDFLKDTHEDFKQFLEASFKEISDKNIKSLVIDLRTDKGGQDDNGALLYSYLTAQPFRYFAVKRSVSGPVDNALLALQQPQAVHYTGKVIILTSGQTFSTAADFSAIARSNGRGIFVGEETGGAYYGNTSGDRATVILPNTQIRVNIPLDEYVNAVKETGFKDRGVIPDDQVAPTEEDILENKDVQMAKALKLAEKE